MRRAGRINVQWKPEWIKSFESGFKNRLRISDENCSWQRVPDRRCWKPESTPIEKSVLVERSVQQRDGRNARSGRIMLAKNKWLMNTGVNTVTRVSWRAHSRSVRLLYWVSLFLAISYTLFFFYARRYCISSVLALDRCPSVRLSLSCIVSTLLKISYNFFPIILAFGQSALHSSKGKPPNGGFK